MHTFQRLGTLLLVVGVAACTDTPTVEPTASGARKSSPQKQSTSVRTDKTSDNPKVTFHTNNRADWVGQAHNRGLDAIYTELFKEKANSNICATIEQLAAAPERIPDGHDKSTASSRHLYARMGLMSTHLCPDNYGLNANSALFLTNYSRRMNVTAVEGMSAEAQGVLDQIGSAVLAVSTSSELAANLNSILAQMPTLTSTESDVVYSVASVSQSSYEYWESNYEPLTQQVSSIYGNCLGQYSDEDTAMSICMGVSSGPVQPTRYLRGTSSVTLILAASMGPRICSFSWGDVAEADFAGAGTGAVYGALGGPGGIFGGAAIGGLGASTFTGWAKLGRYAYCFARGGIASKDATN